MRTSALSLIVALALALGACGKQQPSGNGRQTTAPPATALAPPPQTAAPAATEEQREDVGLAPRPSKATRPNEDGSETVEETAGDTGTHNPLLAAVASTMAASTASALAATTTTAPTLWQEGVNYTRLVPGQPTSVAPGQVEVLEFFWYGCPHCFAIDPMVESWRKTKPAYIAFSRVPVMWSEGHRSTARLYYTLESMGKLDQLHGEVFKEIHTNGNPLIAADPNDTAGALRVQAAFLKKFGISEDAFQKASQSFAVETALQRADQLVLRYRIEGVPTFVVNGKFVADARSAGSPERLLSLVDDLATQEHKH
jgi:protein dithiol oxidoreductase (disulfide-forming)